MPSSPHIYARVIQAAASLDKEGGVLLDALLRRMPGEGGGYRQIDRLLHDGMSAEGRGHLVPRHLDFQMAKDRLAEQLAKRGDLSEEKKLRTLHEADSYLKKNEKYMQYAETPIMQHKVTHAIGDNAKLYTGAAGAALVTNSILSGAAQMGADAPLYAAQPDRLAGNEAKSFQHGFSNGIDFLYTKAGAGKLIEKYAPESDAGKAASIGLFGPLATAHFAGSNLLGLISPDKRAEFAADRERRIQQAEDVLNSKLNAESTGIRVSPRGVLQGDKDAIRNAAAVAGEKAADVAKQYAKDNPQKIEAVKAKARQEIQSAATSGLTEALPSTGVMTGGGALLGAGLGGLLGSAIGNAPIHAIPGVPIDEKALKKHKAKLALIGLLAGGVLGGAGGYALKTLDNPKG